MTVNDSKQLCEDYRIQQVYQQVFSNHLILRQIAKNCSVQDLKSFRLISTATYNASFSIWRKQATLCLGPTRGWGRINMNEFLGRLKNSPHLSIKPFRNFTLEYCTLPPANLQETEDWKGTTRAEFRFWKECGAEIKHLQLKHCTFDQMTLVNMICKLVPNLESLEIIGIRKAHGGGEMDRTHWKIHENLKSLRVSGYLPFPNWRFLEYFPNLQEIKVDQKSTDGLMSDLALLRQQSQGSTLSIQRLNVIHTQQSLYGLAQAQLPAEDLSLRLDRDVQEDQTREIVKSQCTTLQRLTLFRFPLPNSLPMSSSPLQANFTVLKELHLWGKVSFSFNFLKWMPSLKKLVVDLLCIDNYGDYSKNLQKGQLIDPYFGDMVKASNVLLEADNFVHETLEHFQMDYALSSESLSILGKWMPGIKSFGGILNNQTLSQVCGQWKGLKELKLFFGSDVCDLGITGMTLTLGKENRQPNLTDLNDLRSFSLDCYCDSSRITDASVYHAFLQMPKLDNLRMCVSPQVSQVAEALLRQSIQNVTVFRNYGEHSACPEVNCCQRVDFYFKTKH